MRTTAISFILMALPAFLFADDNKDPELVKVYCFSEDLEAGFKDKVAHAFCREVTKNGKKKKSLVDADRESSHVVVQFLGSGKFVQRGETTFVSGGYAWTPDATVNNASAVAVVVDFAKRFSAEGTGFQAVGGVADQVEEWIRENRDTILEKAKAQQ